MADPAQRTAAQRTEADRGAEAQWCEWRLGKRQERRTVGRLYPLHSVCLRCAEGRALGTALSFWSVLPPRLLALCVAAAEERERKGGAVAKVVS
jgi:hypothetical protein